MGSLDNISDIITNIRSTKQRVATLNREANQLEEALRENTNEQVLLGDHIRELNASLLKQAHHPDE